MKGLQVQASIFVCALKLSICAEGAQGLSRLGLIQHYLLSYLQVMFTIAFNCYNTRACIVGSRGASQLGGIF